MTFNWLWTKVSYNCWKCGEYIVTGHKCSAIGVFYLAYFRDKQISDGPHENAAAAKQACVDHSQEIAA